MFDNGQQFSLKCSDFPGIGENEVIFLFSLAITTDTEYKVKYLI